MLELLCQCACQRLDRLLADGVSPADCGQAYPMAAAFLVLDWARQAAIDLFFRAATMSEKDIWQTASEWDMCERDEVLRRLGSLKLLVRDAMVYAADLDEQIINSDCLERFAQAKNVWSQRTLSLFMRELVKREQSVKNNGNIKLVIEAMLLAWRSMIQRR